MLKISPTCIIEGMDTSDEGQSHRLESLVAEANGLIGMKKCVHVASLHSKLELQALGVLSVPTYKNRKDGCKRRPDLEKCLRT
jgi:hypothetical protein